MTVFSEEQALEFTPGFFFMFNDLGIALGHQMKVQRAKAHVRDTCMSLTRPVAVGCSSMDELTTIRFLYPS